MMARARWFPNSGLLATENRSAAYRGYLLVKESAGWRITGVTPEKPRASGV